MASFPAAVGPGMVTSNVVGSTYQNMTPQAEAYYYRELDRKREEREQRNAEIRAQQAQQAQTAQNAANQERVRSAFNQLYGQQLQNAYHDQMVMSEGVPGTGVANRGLGIAPGGQSRLSSGNMKPWSEPGSFTPQGGWYKLPQDKLNTALDNMWRMRTDPYMRTAGQLGAGISLGLPGVGGGSKLTGRAALGGGGGGSETARKKKPEGIDWWKEQNQGPGEMQYETLHRG